MRPLRHRPGRPLPRPAGPGHRGGGRARPARLRAGRLRGRRGARRPCGRGWRATPRCCPAGKAAVPDGGGDAGGPAGRDRGRRSTCSTASCPPAAPATACSSPARARLTIRNARFAEDERPADPACGCYTCRTFTRAYLRHLFKCRGAPRAAAQHHPQRHLLPRRSWPTRARPSRSGGSEPSAGSGWRPGRRAWTAEGPGPGPRMPCPRRENAVRNRRLFTHLPELPCLPSLHAFLAQTAEGQTQSLSNMLIPLVLMGAVFYFLLIRPQQKQAKEHQKLLTGLKRGDEVVTQGGLIGVRVPGRGPDRHPRHRRRHQGARAQGQHHRRLGGEAGGRTPPSRRRSRWNGPGSAASP